MNDEEIMNTIVYGADIDPEEACYRIFGRRPCVFTGPNDFIYSVTCGYTERPQAVALSPATRSTLGYSVKNSLFAFIENPRMMPRVIFNDLFVNNQVSWIVQPEASRTALAIHGEEVRNALVSDREISIADYLSFVAGLYRKTDADTALWLLQLVCNNMFVYFIPDRPAIIERPTVYTDDRGRIHSAHGPAVYFRDGTSRYLWHGSPAKKEHIERGVSLNDILSERNTELRRSAISIYGEARFLMDSGAEVVDSDYHWGTLYRKDVAGDEPIVMLSVLNSTPEPDGSLKRYFLRVPPDVTTAFNAQAWLAGMTPKEFWLDKET